MNSWGDYSSEAREGYYIRPIFVIRIVSSYLGLMCTQFKRLAQTSCFVSKKPFCTKRKMSWQTCQGHLWLKLKYLWKSLILKKIVQNLQIPKTWCINTIYVSKTGRENNEILLWIKITNFVIRTFTPIIYQTSYPITVKGREVKENIIGINSLLIN